MSNAATIQAQALAELGEKVGEGITKFQQNQRVKKLDTAFGDKIKNDPMLSMTLLGQAFPRGTTTEDGTLIPATEDAIKSYESTLKEFQKSMRSGLGNEAYQTVVAQAIFGDLFKEEKEKDEFSSTAVQGVFDFIDTSDQYDIRKIDGKNTVVRIIDGEEYKLKEGDEIFNLKGADTAISMIQGDPLNLYGDSKPEPEPKPKVEVEEYTPIKNPSFEPQGDVNPIFQSTLFCWVAREVYGAENPRWLAFRQWMLVESPSWFRDLYIKYGERFAKFISNKPLIKSIIRKWMDTKIS